ncbi:MAG: twin transmembrane helix small protein [Maricaulaceae bacterium]
METAIDLIIIVALAAVLVALAVGIYALLRGEKAKNLSNRMMRLRVLFQFIAVIALVAGWLIKSRYG